MSPIAVVSSVYGGYDTIREPPAQTIDCDWVLVTDTPVDCPPWRNIVDPRPGLSARVAAKYPKCRPDLFVYADAIIWVDANVTIRAPDFVEWCVSHPGALAQIPHPQRTRITDEAAVLAEMGEYQHMPVREQAQHYIDGGFPDGWGLWATGLIVYQPGYPFELGDEWLDEINRWTPRDQLSQAPLLHRAGIRPTDIAGPLWGNPRFKIRGHRS